MEENESGMLSFKKKNDGKKKIRKGIKIKERERDIYMVLSNATVMLSHVLSCVVQCSTSSKHRSLLLLSKKYK